MRDLLEGVPDDRELEFEVLCDDDPKIYRLMQYIGAISYTVDDIKYGVLQFK